MKNRRNTVKQSAKNILLSLFAGLAVLGAAAVESRAQTNSVITRPGGRFYYPKNSQAVGRQRAEMRKGNSARVFYDTLLKKWVVEVRYPANVTTTTTTRRPATTPTGPGQLPNGATVLYFPARDTADGIYRASLRQGDWAKMWYDEGRREWAVAVKPRL